MSLLLLVALTLPAAAPEGAPLHPPRRAPSVTLPDPRRFDADGDRVEDVLAARLKDAPPKVPVRVELVFSRPVTQRQLDDFTRAGGELEWVYQSLSWGFVGRVSPEALPRVTRLLSESLLLVKGDDPMVHDLDKATRNARARSVWQPNFAGSDGGFLGSPTTTIALVDTGIDATHPDLAGRMAYWRDFQGTAPTPIDLEGHGSCVASVALGSGAAFEASAPAFKWTKSWDARATGPGNVVARQPLSFVASPVTISSTATFDGPNPARFALSSSPPALRTFITVVSQTGTSPVSISGTVGNDAGLVYSVNISQADGGTISWATAASTATPYPPLGDGMPTFRGMAPGCRWASARAADDALAVSMALDDLMTNRQALGLKVINLSQSPTGDGGTLLPDKALALIQGGVIVVKTAGNTGRSATNPFVTSPGDLGLVFTVGSTNTDNQLTQYTSQGRGQWDAGQDMKPDLLAPGGSPLRTHLICADSNSSDNPNDGGADLVPDDYTTDEGTSFSAPVVAGASALVIQALESKGLAWDWTSANHPRLVKAILLGSATETNQPREVGPSANPTLGRAAHQKDLAEGYGVLNVDAALETVLVNLTLPVTQGTDGGIYDRRAWGFQVGLDAGVPFEVAMETPYMGDYDVYLYAEAPDPFGNPVLLAASDRAGAGIVERLSYTPTTAQLARLVVKRISGWGNWTLMPKPPCGNNVKEIGEECDDGNLVDGDCCSANCLAEATGQKCAWGACEGGFCIAPICGDGNLSFPETCDDGNTYSNDCCSATCQVDPDGTACTGGVCAGGRCLKTVKVPAVADGTASEPPAALCGCGSAEGLGAALGLAVLALRRRRR